MRDLTQKVHSDFDKNLIIENTHGMMKNYTNFINHRLGELLKDIC